MYPKHVVSTKLALYAHDASCVLVMRYPLRKRNGLPGGHVESREHPDAAIRREFMEELGVELGEIKRVDFFLREGSKGPIILAYTATAPEGFETFPTRPTKEYAEWVRKEELSTIDMSPEYIRFALENWPA